MARPRKPPGYRRELDLRIPVTAAEKQRILDALAGEEFAGWARGILLEKAEEMIAVRSPQEHRPKARR